MGDSSHDEDTEKLYMIEKMLGQGQEPQVDYVS